MAIRKRPSKKAKNGYTWQVYFDRYNYYQGGFLTKKEAQEHEAMKLAEFKETGTLKKENKKTLNEVYDEFLEIGASKYSHNTIYNTKKDYKYIQSIFGKLLIRDIDYPMLQRFFNKRSSEGLETNKNIKKVFSRIFEYAFKVGYIKVNPIPYLEVKGIKNIRDKKVLSYDDFQSMINAIEENDTFRMKAYSVAVKIGYYTGLRVSEVCALEKSDFDFYNNTITISKKINYKGLSGNTLEVSDELKSKSSYSTIPLADILKEELIIWFNKNPYNIIICDEKGKHIIPDCMLNYLRKLGKRLGIDFHFHMLRHSFATMLNEKDIDMKTRQELMRHNDISTTLNIYTHSNIEHKKEVVNSLFDCHFSEKTVKNTVKFN